ncbi:hypothetical protein CHLNCDRAFT_142716 [Chlorella variabilis]|uniref:Uncharacterized protein n=1 Tax=Chlorella variabilis TaxID=554065 RepID=E1Z8K0_CHLVA|nr:hypothetical protein CHLNCDRAFT_142716 [Chlorella variabilis]EFN57351.1 hypothetical protein CHLNCDRAFT_142716 [Chlorella variabilis]|eukprot:XP_005849453.1 hypothetical protein CHLNCDRAFT_142716 [Chlorella variabilis]
MSAKGLRPGNGRQTDLLKQFHLSRNPFVDRTAEKTELDDVSLYIHSDLQGFKPSGESWCALIRLAPPRGPCMQRAYQAYNDAARASGKTRGHFVIDLSRPGHLTGCLRQFQERVGASDENWDALFSEAWTSADMVDCMLSYAATHLVDEVTDTASVEGMDMLERIRSDPRAAKQFLLLAHLYAKTDANSLDFLRAKLLPARYSALQLTAAAGVGTVLAGGTAIASHNPELAGLLSGPLEAVRGEVEANAPFLTDHPRLSLALAGTAALGGAYLYRRHTRTSGLGRAAALVGQVRVVKQQQLQTIAAMLGALFSSHDSAETIRQLCIGVSAHQKLDLLSGLVRLLGFESLAVFGDCFDEVVLLDPVLYPGALKVFAREVCKNDMLSFGRMHLFFPDSRLSLDLNTDKTLKAGLKRTHAWGSACRLRCHVEARFDRHFVRDLQWSRHQLEELAERRFMAAQMEQLRRNSTSASASSGGGEVHVEDKQLHSFADLFNAIKVEDFSSYISKLTTPRELMLFMTELLARIEAHPDNELSAQDMEIAVAKALEQAV